MQECRLRLGWKLQRSESHHHSLLVHRQSGFGQAEVDTQIVNFTRFSVFFPEKCDFFLENAGATFRPNAHLLFDFSDSFNSVRLPQGEFTTNLVAGRVNYNFSRKLLTSALMQLNSAARLSAINIRLRYIYKPNSDLFVIYNQTTGASLERPSYSFQVKLTRDFTF